jgi:hypothetical protein
VQEVFAPNYEFFRTQNWVNEPKDILHAEVAHQEHRLLLTAYGLRVPVVGKLHY